jgi:EmrB/QacA subfamily drug resistance transporter
VKRTVGTLLAVYIAALAITVDVTIVNVALPSLATELGAGTRALQWIVDGYNLSFAALVLAAGSLSDRYGRRPALILGLLGFAGSSAAGALVHSTGALIAARFGMGVFAAFIFPTTLSVIANTFPGRRQRAAALGGWSGITGVGVAAGPIVGGYLLQHFFWGSVFWALVPVALIGAVIALIAVPESRNPNVPPLDMPGLGVSVAMLGLLTYTIIEAPNRGWHGAATVSGLVIAALLVGLFVVIERRAKHPMLDVRLFKDRRFSAASGAVTVQFFALSGFIFLVTQYFQIVRGFGTFSTGIRILPVAISIAVASVVGSVLAPRLGTKMLVVTGLASFGAAMAWAATSTVTTSYWASIVPQMILIGLGMGLTAAPATESIMRVLPPARAGVGSAVNDATRQLGGTLGVAIIGSIFSSVWAHKLADTAFSSSGQLEPAKQSVAFAFGVAAKAPNLLSAAQGSYMSGQNVGCWVLAGLSFLGALAGVIALPGRRFAGPAPAVDEADPVEVAGAQVGARPA